MNGRCHENDLNLATMEHVEQLVENGQISTKVFLIHETMMGCQSRRPTADRGGWIDGHGILRPPVGMHEGGQIGVLSGEQRLSCKVSSIEKEQAVVAKIELIHKMSVRNPKVASIIA